MSREYSGEQEARAVVEWLNSSGSGRDKQRRIERLVENFTVLRTHEIDAARSRKMVRRTEGPREDMMPPAEVDARDIAEVSGEELKQVAGGYFTLSIYPHSRRELPKDEQRALREVVAEIRGAYIHSQPGLTFEVPGKAIHIHWRGRDDYETAKFYTIQQVLALAEAGLLVRLRRCAQCEKWFYARFRHQNFCLTRCQQANYRSSEEWKAHRRKWMRDYRSLKESGNVR